MVSVKEALKDNRLTARVARSASWIMIGYGASQALRLASNLILARLLFPEAFGLMALITLVTVGLAMFSDVGIAPSIAQSKRGDDPDFLDTAWTIQIIRGVSLWIVATGLSWPMAWFYGVPELTTYLPIAAVSLLITGFNPTRIETANRHLLVGRVTMLDILAQALAAVMIVFLAWWLRDVIALVIGNIISALAYLTFTHFGLPGQRNRLRWEKTALTELVHFGKWIFLSTVCWFFASQGDRAVLGKFLTLENLGIYNIGYFLASFPLLLGLQVTSKIMIPVYREKAGDLHRVKKMRYMLTGALLSMLLVAAMIGPWVVGILYDDRYLAAGAIVTVICVALIPQVIGMSYDQAALAAGDSRRFFMFSAIRSVLQVGLLLIGALMGGLIGALVGMGLAIVIAHPFLIWLARAHGVWDMRHDMLYGSIGAVVGALAIWLHWGEIVAMAQATAS